MPYNLKEVVANKPSRFSEGHRMCAGCGAPAVARMVLRALKRRRSCCNCYMQLDVWKFLHLHTHIHAWTDSFIHTAFENAGSYIIWC